LNSGFKPSESLSKELKEHCRQKMAPFKVPRFIKFLNELPKTGQGKIDKRQLLEHD
jgi:acyl-coenzyme A synthetase/AMP-(fatty) acid ligase